MITPHYADDSVTLWHGDSLNVLANLPDSSVDAIVTDPPYGLEFMGKEWDSFKPASARLRKRMDGRTNPAEGKSTTNTPEAYVAGMPFQQWCQAWATEALRVLKPGGHMIAFGGTRTWHRLVCGVEDAGFEIRDTIAWLYGSGFPKSVNVSRAVDQHRAARSGDRVNAVRTWLNQRRLDAGLSLTQVNEAVGGASNGGGLASSWMTNPTSRALPSWEQWLQLRALLGFGIDMDGEVRDLHAVAAGTDRPVIGQRSTGLGVGGGTVPIITEGSADITTAATEAAAAWEGWGTALKPGFEPAMVARKPLVGTVATNVIEHGTGALHIDACRLEAGDDYRAKCASVVGLNTNRNGTAYGEWTGARVDSAHDAGRWPANVTLDPAAAVELDDNARFFPAFRYEAKAPTSERPNVNGVAHSTVKPLDLMRWLVRLVTPVGGLVLDPFSGSGTTAEACVIEGFRCIAIERDETYLPLITSRLTKPLQTTLFAA